MLSILRCIGYTLAMMLIGSVASPIVMSNTIEVQKIKFDFNCDNKVDTIFVQKTDSLMFPVYLKLAGDISLLGRDSIPFAIDNNLKITKLTYSFGHYNSDSLRDIKLWLTSTDDTISKHYLYRIFSQKLIDSIQCFIVSERVDSSSWHFLTTVQYGDSCMGRGFNVYKEKRIVRPLMKITDSIETISSYSFVASIFPNPVSDVITLRYSVLNNNDQSSINCKIVAVESGKIFIDEKLLDHGFDNLRHLDVSTLCSGSYFVVCFLDDKIVFQKMINVVK